MSTEKMTTEEVIRTTICMILLVLLMCIACTVAAKINTKEDPVARTHYTGMSKYSTRWKK